MHKPARRLGFLLLAVLLVVLAVPALGAGASARTDGASRTQDAARPLSSADHRQDG